MLRQRLRIVIRIIFQTTKHTNGYSFAPADAVVALGLAAVVFLVVAVVAFAVNGGGGGG